MTPEAWLIALIVISLSFDFLNGFHDSANVVATMISSRAMSGKAALMLALVPAISALAAVPLLNEPLVTTTLAGLLCVTLGAILGALPGGVTK